MVKKIELIKPTKLIRQDETSLIIQKKCVAAYTRVSTDYADQLNSYRVQCEEYTNKIMNNSEWIFKGVFADQGISGTQAKKRPEFMKMIELAKAGEIDLILTKSISRFGRNTAELITIIRELRELNVEVFFEKENISSLDPKLDFLLTILSSVAQEESRTVSTNVKWTYEKKFKKGIVDPRRIYGYEVIDNKFSIIPDEAKVIRQIFYLISQGFNINDIRKTLESNNIKRHDDKPFSYSGIQYLLTNEKYCGDALLGKTVCVDYLTKKIVKNDNISDKYYVSNNHEPIISRELFEDVQLILNSKVQLRGNNQTSKYPLTGILYCPKCGRTLKRQQIIRKNKKVYILNCNHQLHNPFICKSYSPRYDLILESTIDSVKELFSNDDYLDVIFEAIDNRKIVDNLKAEKNNLQLENQNLTVHFDRSLSQDEDLSQINFNQNKINELNQVIAKLITSNIRLDYLKGISNSEIDFTKFLYKNLYSLILADEQSVKLVITPNIPLDNLINNLSNILNIPSLFKRFFIDSSGTQGIYYEVIIYEQS
ncbi:MAG: recombinase family protein [Erysipelotrichales bacterium]|nr:recombinase family protein [Erysipelotrichales bacterium]